MKKAGISFSTIRMSFVLALAIHWAPVQQGQGAIVYSDNFNRASLNGGTYAYATTVSSGDGAASIVGNDQLQLSNDGSATANANGRVFVTTPTSAFGSPFNSQLNLNSGLVTWTFNMQQIRTDPAGFGGGNYGAALVLGATSSDFLTANGYAIVLGQTGTPDPIRLVSFASGLDANANLANIITGTSPLADPAASYLSLRVTYNPANNGWSLEGRNDGTSFSDPSSGSLSFAGSATDSTYTGSSLSQFGVLWNYSSAANQTALFDNFTIESVPEPAGWGVISAGGLLAVAGFHSWRQNRRAKARASA